MKPTLRFIITLKKNISLNKINNITCINKAIGSDIGRVHFSDISSDDQNKIIDNGGLIVEITPLYMLINEWQINLLKIDVEGFEFEVLRGTEKLFESIECIYFESYEDHFQKYNYSTRNILSYLSKNGFSNFKLVKNILTKIRDDYISQKCENLVAIKNLNNFIQRTGYKMEYNQINITE